MEQSEEDDIDKTTVEEAIKREIIPTVKKYFQKSEKVEIYAEEIKNCIIRVAQRSETLTTDQSKEKIIGYLDDELEQSSEDIETTEEMIRNISEEKFDKLIDMYVDSTRPTSEKTSAERSLGEIEEFLVFEEALNIQGIYTIEDFLGLVSNNPDGIKDLLDINNEELKELIEAAKNELSEEELNQLEGTEIKQIGEDYKLGLRFKEEEE